MAKPWADQPYQLMPIPGQPGAPTCKNKDVLTVAAEMANVHNLFIRGLNSIVLQTPHVTLAPDISDLLFYIRCWADTVHHHHHFEETMIFPQFNVLAKEAGLPETVMDPNVDQHQKFEGKLQETLGWVDDVRAGKKEYDCKTLMGLVGGFAPPLMEHLHDEIETLLKLEPCDGTRILRVMEETAKESLKIAVPETMIPLVYGSVDRSFPGSEGFPPAPFFLPWLNAYWYSRKYRGSWRFNPCDHWGKPRPLQFL